jgi:hypothetical protein
MPSHRSSSRAPYVDRLHAEAAQHAQVLADVPWRRRPDTAHSTGASPAALGEPVRLRDLVDVDADHRLAETAGDLGDDVRGRRRTWSP